MDYSPEIRETLDYIYSFTANSRKKRLENGLENEPSLKIMRDFAEYLGNPQLSYPVIHIAGTKGKGSTANYIASVLQQAGYRVGLFTSPHLDDFSERMKIDGEMIPHERVVEYVDQIREFTDQTQGINFFEIITGIAFTYFRDAEVDIAVIEVGLGGRLDATNIVKPLMSVITSISFDHMQILGDTLEKIAVEKAGIIKENIPVVVGKQKDDAVIQVFERTAREKNASLIHADLIFDIQGRTISINGQSFTVRDDTGNETSLWIPLLGNHQVENATIAFGVLEQCRKLGYAISDEALKTGFQKVNWPARFEIISKKPLIVVDGAHNTDSLLRLIETVKSLFRDQQVLALFGVSMGKDIERMLSVFLPNVDHCIFTRSTHPRSEDPQRLVQLADKLGFHTSYEDTIENAFESITPMLNENAILLCTGSLFLAAAARDVWKSKQNLTEEKQNE